MNIVIIYSFYETEIAKNNLNYFLNNENDIKQCNNIKIIFVINNYNINNLLLNKILKKYKNVSVYFKKNFGRDFGAYEYFLLKININEFDYFIFLNDTILGPLENNWISSLTSKINDKTKLVGTSINYKPIFKSIKLKKKHLKSYIFCTDLIGLNILISNNILNNVKNNLSKYKYIKYYEVGMSIIINKNDYLFEITYNEFFKKNRKLII